MQYAIVSGQKQEPLPQMKGVCEICGAETIAKCGEKVRWHWAHRTKQSCDPWWENETQWHRDWKAHFPESYREVSFRCEKTDEKHRADVVTDKKLVLEIQNSPISLAELRSREEFYKNLVWVVNGGKFKERFEILPACLPDPNASEFDDIVFFGSGARAGETFWRKSENPEALENSSSLVLVHSARKIKQTIQKHYIGHHPFQWTRPHIAWFDATCPVFIDFGDELLWRLERYRDQFCCVRAISKNKFIHDVMTETNATDIAAKFYSIKNRQSSMAQGRS